MGDFIVRVVDKCPVPISDFVTFVTYRRTASCN